MLSVPPPPLRSHPCIPHFLSPSRQCIPIPHTVTSGESCLPCATGPTKRCCSRASPHRPGAEHAHGESTNARRESCFVVVRQTDSGECRPLFVMEVSNVHVSTSYFIFFCLFSLLRIPSIVLRGAYGGGLAG